VNRRRARADKSLIDDSSAIRFPAIRNAPLARRLWLGAGGVVLFMLTVALATPVMAHRPAPPRAAGLDFLAFYTAGAAVREGRVQDLYDLNATSRFQQAVADREKIALGRRFAPWWNPPFYSLPFVPLSRLPFHAALIAWLLLSLICAAAACLLLCRTFPSGTTWKTRSLVPALIVLSTPFIATLTHGQNTCTSLVLLTITVLLWRDGRPLAAGLVGGLLLYKPQLAVAIAAVMVLDLGWRAALGYAITGFALLALNMLILPGSLENFLHEVPLNLSFLQSQGGYPFERHVTFTAFWRMLLQGNAAGQTQLPAETLSVLCICTLGVCLVATVLKPRSTGSINNRIRDRLIAATIAATPLLMPFYFDYDLLLLVVPAVLLTNDLLRHSEADPTLVAVWTILYAWLMVNPDVAEHFRINLAVPLLALLSALLLRRATQPALGSFEPQGSTPTRRSIAPQ
jgi:hypothetical protein